jgi:cyclic pyranopterin phosphate synthase
MPGHIFGEQYRFSKNLMSSDEIITLASIFQRLGVRKIRITGGEPLVRSDAGSIMRRLSELPVKLTLTTNASLIHRHAEDLIASGIRSVNISLDSLEADAFRILTERDQFTTVMNNIQWLLGEGFRVKVNMVVLKGKNDHEVERFVDWTKDRELHVRFIEYMPFTFNGWSQELLVPMDDLVEKISQAFPIERLEDRPNDTARNYRVKGYLGTFAFIATMSQPFCSTCNRLRLTADGKLKNCLFSSGETDLLTPLRNGEDLEHRIRETVLAKKEARGGQMNEPLESIEPSFIQNRSMIAIGG